MAVTLYKARLHQATERVVLAFMFFLPAFGSGQRTGTELSLAIGMSRTQVSTLKTD